MTRRWTILVVAVAASLAAGCGNVNAALERLSQARHLSADLLVEFTKASDATDRAVMADTDPASMAFAQEAGRAKQAVHDDAAALGPLLAGLGYADETRLLDDFDKELAAYERLDRQILDLAVENTNLKAQRLSFGEAQAAAREFEKAVASAAPGNPKDAWQVKAIAQTAIGALREIQVLQAPHIAAADDASMAGIEAHMAAAETTARSALAALSSIAAPSSRPRLAASADALNRFVEINRQIVALSRRNTNVRSLALSLNAKQKLTAPCEETLRALADALAHRGYPKGRWE